MKYGRVDIEKNKQADLMDKGYVRITVESKLFSIYRVVQLNFTLEIEVLNMLFDIQTGDMIRRPGNGLHQLGQPVAPSILFPGRHFISPVCI